MVWHQIGEGRCTLDQVTEDIVNNTSGIIKVENDTVYFGSLISMKACRENLSRRLGEASETSRDLSKVWSHANMRRDENLKLSWTCVIHKLLYMMSWSLLLCRYRSRRLAQN